MKEKNEYSNAELEIVRFEVIDVVTSSTYGDNIDKDGWT